MSPEQDPGPGPGQESKQFCSVCKEWLTMEVVPTGDGDDDGVVWYRCPQCQGFLPKLKSALEEDAAGDPATAAADPAADPAVDPEDDPLSDDLPYDSPAEMMAARRAAAVEDDVDLAAAVDLDPAALETLPVPDVDVDAPGAGAGAGAKESAGEEESEPIAEYAAQLAAALDEMPADASGGRPYRPWETYEVGQCIQHLAWEDCGIVVAKESLPGGRQVIKAYFQAAGVVRLIEQAPR